MQPDEQSMWKALSRVVEAGEHVVADRVDLARVQLEESIARTAKRSALIGAAGALVALAWIAGMASLAVGLARVSSVPASLGVVAAIHVALAAVAWILFQRVGREKHNGHAGGVEWKAPKKT